MINLQRISIDLQNDYSTLNVTSKKLIRKFYSEISSPNKEVTELVNMWKDDFEFIYGNINENLSSNKKIKPQKLAESYMISEAEQNDILVTELFMSIQTYLSLLVRLMAQKLVNSVKNGEDNNTSFKDFILGIISGRYFKERGIENYCYEDWFSWIIYSWDDELELLIQDLYKELGGYDTINDVESFKEFHNNDYIKQIYETIIPKELRHALGEYYTPDWLAQYTIEESLKLSSYEMKNTKFLDPTCGSGTFLFKLLQNIKKDDTNISTITKQVFGFDINSLAVLTSKTNYLISIIDLLNKETVVHFPVYNYDVINSPVENDGHLEIDLNNNHLYKIPIEWIKDNTYSQFINQIIVELSKSQKPVSGKLNFENEAQEELYIRIKDHSPEMAKIIINMLVNRIEGYMVNKVDVIVGNPPWVNWEYLPQEYRFKSAHLWKDYGIFSVKGRDLSFSKEDISVLITYLVIDKYLVDEGHLGFVIRQGLFKSAQNGVGFRKFKVKDDGYDIKALRVDDLSKVKPFENASNSTAILFIQKNKVNQYPVPYYMWEKKKSTKRYSLGSYDDLNDILAHIDIDSMIAIPAVKDDITSMWITAKKDALDAIDNVLGTNNYKARTGIFTGGANAVYWMQVHGISDDGNAQISNITERAKRKVENIECEIETEFIYPLVQGSDIQKWRVDTKAYILCPHTAETKMKPVDKQTMELQYPLTYKYLNYFKEDLDKRKGFAGWEKEIQKENFHAILRVGEYTFAKYKVAWRYIATEFITTVISDIDDTYLGKKSLIPNEKVMYISTDNEHEAYYLCGILSSDPIAFSVKSYMNPTSISAHVLEKLKIHEFDPENIAHRNISKLCKQGHESDDANERNRLLEEINLWVAEIYSINKEKMKILNEAVRKS